MAHKLFSGRDGHRAEDIYNYFLSQGGIIYSIQPIPPKGEPIEQHTCFIWLDTFSFEVTDYDRICTWLKYLGLISPRWWWDIRITKFFLEGLLDKARHRIIVVNPAKELAAFDLHQGYMRWCDPKEFAYRRGMRAKNAAQPYVQAILNAKSTTTKGQKQCS
ncbi:MAG TPA: hypothetical protein VGL38_09455 [bacterium]